LTREYQNGYDSQQEFTPHSGQGEDLYIIITPATPINIGVGNARIPSKPWFLLQLYWSCTLYSKMPCFL